MGWEWRLFYHGDLRAAFRDHVAARLPTLRRKGDDELRTDVYVRCGLDGVASCVRCCQKS